MIYILEFSRPLGDWSNPRGQARYYTGWCEDHRLNERLQEHQTGAGAAITRAAVRAGVTLTLVATIPGATRADERRLKTRYKNTPRLVERRRRRGALS